MAGVKALLRLSAGLVIWAAAFCLVYALHGIGCANGWDGRSLAGISVQRLVLLTAWAGSLAAASIVALRLTRRRATTLDRAAMATGWIGVAATVFTFLPVLAIPPCV